MCKKSNTGIISSISNAQAIAFVRKAARFLLFSRIWIALGAAALSTWTLHSRDIRDTLLPFIVFGGTWAVYTWLQPIGPDYPSGAHSARKWRLITGLVLAFWGLMSSPFFLTIILVAGFGLVWLYARGLPGFWPPLRQLPYLKVLGIAGVWTLVTYGLPWAGHVGDPAPQFAAIGALARFLFVAGITLPFDLKDQGVDVREGTPTLPLLLGWPCTRALAFTALLLSSLATGLEYRSTDYPLSMAITLILALILVGRARENRTPAYYYGLIDGLLLLPWLIHDGLAL